MVAFHAPARLIHEASSESARREGADAGILERCGEEKIEMGWQLGGMRARALAAELGASGPLKLPAPAAE